MAEDIPDPRTHAQRNADALVELCDLARGHNQMSSAGGEPPHVTVTVDYDTLLKQLSGATLDYGQRLSAAQARLAACDSKIIPVVMGGDGEPLDVGRAQRTGCPWGSAGHWSPATADAASPAVTVPPHCAIPTTSGSGITAVTLK